MDELPPAYSGTIAFLSLIIRRILYYIFVPLDYFLGKNQEDEITPIKLSQLNLDIAEEFITPYMQAPSALKRKSDSLLCLIPTSAIKSLEKSENLYRKTEREGYPLTVEIQKRDATEAILEFDINVSTRQRALNPFAVIQIQSKIIVCDDQASFESLINQ